MSLGQVYYRHHTLAFTRTRYGWGLQLLSNFPLKLHISDELMVLYRQFTAECMPKILQLSVIVVGMTVVMLRTVGVCKAVTVDGVGIEYIIFIGLVADNGVDASRAYAPHKVNAFVIVRVQAVRQALNH